MPGSGVTLMSSASKSATSRRPAITLPAIRSTSRRAAENYQAYLDKHPSGVFGSEATAALQAIEADWDKHDFRAVRDHFLATPNNIPELVNRCRSYLAVHPQGRFNRVRRRPAPLERARHCPRRVPRGPAQRPLRQKVARFFSRGPDLSVEIEVGGVRYGPSNIVKNDYNPEWDYEFPRRIRWKLGDPIRVRVTDHDWKDRVVVEIATQRRRPPDHVPAVQPDLLGPEPSDVRVRLHHADTAQD